MRLSISRVFIGFVTGAGCGLLFVVLQVCIRAIARDRITLFSLELVEYLGSTGWILAARYFESSCWVGIVVAVSVWVWLECERACSIAKCVIQIGAAGIIGVCLAGVARVILGLEGSLNHLQDLHLVGRLCIFAFVPIVAGFRLVFRHASRIAKQSGP